MLEPSASAAIIAIFLSVPNVFDINILYYNNTDVSILFCIT